MAEDVMVVQGERSNDGAVEQCRRSCRIMMVVALEKEAFEGFGEVLMPEKIKNKFRSCTALHKGTMSLLSMSGRLPVMVMSDLCRMSSADKKDCQFDHGGYFIIKGAEKTFIAQEQICLRRLSISKDPTWTVTYLYIKLTSKTEKVLGADKILTVYFYVTEIPIWVLFFALGVTNDKKIVKMINIGTEDSTIANILIASIYEADIRFESFRKEGNAVKHISNLMKGCKYPPEESVEQCIQNYFFPNLCSLKQKASFLAYMVKYLLEAYRGLRKTDNRDDLKNKRLELAEEEKDEEIGRDRAKSTKASPPLPQSTTDTGSTETTTANSDDEKLGFFSDLLWVNVIVPTRNPSSQGFDDYHNMSLLVNINRLEGEILATTSTMEQQHKKITDR
ncbi:DNA-directed RNA polymerase, partial [Striga asiatica]